MDKFIKKINTSPLIRKRITAGDNSLQHYPKTFGVPLKKLLEREDMLNIPTVVNSICNFLVLYGLETEGLFRINGNTKAVESLKLLFEENETPTMSNCTDVHAVASVLKCFLRELPDGLISETSTLQLFNVYSHHSSQVEECIEEFKIILRNLPEENFNLLKYLCQFLVQVVEKESLNKMDFKNLGIVFGPNLFKMNQGIEGFKMQTALNNIFTSFISNYNKIFKSIQTQKDLNQCSGSLIDTQLSTDGHKSSPSLSGDFDLSSSNDNPLYPAPLPSVSSDLQKVITSCVNNRLSTPIDDEDFESNKFNLNQSDNAKISRTSSVPQNISGMISNNLPTSNSHDLSLTNSNEPTAPPRSNAISSSQKTQNPNHKKTNDLMKSNNKSSFPTKDCWNDGLKDSTKFSYVSADKNENPFNQTSIIDEILPDWQTQTNMIDLDDFDGEDDLMNDNCKENNSIKPRNETLKNASLSQQQDIIEQITQIRTKLKDFEDNFERQHGCKPQLERSGNTQVQEWLTELMQLKERLGEIHSSHSTLGPQNQLHYYHKTDNASGGDLASKTNNTTCLSQKSNAKSSIANEYLSTNADNTPSLSNITSNTNVLRHQQHPFQSNINSGVNPPNIRPMSMPVQSSNIISNLDSVDSQNLNVIQFLEHLNNALKTQRLKTGRPENLNQMSKEQYDEEKVDLQKCLLHFEKIYGRPRDHNIKQIMKPLYDRYRLVKRFIKTNEDAAQNSSCVTSANAPNSIINSANRSRAMSLNTKEDNEVTNSKMRKEMSDNSAVNTTNTTKYWKPTNSQEDANSSIRQQNSLSLKEATNNTTIVPVQTNTKSSNNPLMKSRNYFNYTSSSIPVNPNEILMGNVPNSAQSAKSFNSLNFNDLIPFKSCSTMSRTEMTSEKELLSVEKRRLQKLLKDFEHGLERMTGRKVDRSDRDHMRPEYDRYKTIKCRLKILQQELEKQL